MSRTSVLSALQAYREAWVQGVIPYAGIDRAEELANARSIEDFIVREPLQACERSCAEGHITSSALVTSLGMDKVLLTLHRKLGKWLQLGGHTDGSWDIPASALREAQEESGLVSVHLVDLGRLLGLSKAVSGLPFDCDVHEIPARRNESTHLHFDIRYLTLVDDRLPLAITAESKDLRWFTLDEARQLTRERSMLRQFDKLDAIRALWMAENLSEPARADF